MFHIIAGNTDIELFLAFLSDWMVCVFRFICFLLSVRLTDLVYNNGLIE